MLTWYDTCLAKDESVTEKFKEEIKPLTAVVPARSFGH